MNDKKINDIKKFMNKVHDKFKDIKFRCEYDSVHTPTYIIEVKPAIFTKNEEYCEMACDFIQQFEKKFAPCEILFISDNSLIEIRNSILEVGYNVSKSKQIPDSYGSNCYV